MTEKVPYAERMRYAEQVVTGQLRAKDIAREVGVGSSTISGWCKRYTKGRIKVERKRKQRWFGILANGEVTHPKTITPTGGTTTISTRTAKGGEWSITIGGYRLTLDKEPALVLLERV